MYQKFSDSSLLISKLKTYSDELSEDESTIETLFLKIAKTNLKLLGKRLQEARKSKGYSQVGLTNILKVRQATFSDWENGKNLPRLDALKQLLELYDVDPGELIDVNPLKLVNDSFIHVVDDDLFRFKTFDTFLFDLKNLEDKKRIPVPASDQLSFAYKVHDSSMLSAVSSNISLFNNSLVLCSTHELSDTTFSQREIICKDKICIVSICHEEPMLRLIKYENGVLSLIALNGDYKSYGFPDGAEYEKFLEDSDNCIYHGQKTYSCSVEIFGIAKKMYVDL